MKIWKPTEARSPADELTPGQRECLRLVQQLQSSKQIARKLGISRFTVDQRLMLACRKLGVHGRAEAALMLAAHDRRSARINDQFDAPILDTFSTSLPMPAPVALEAADELQGDDAGPPAPEFRTRLGGLYRNWPIPSARRPANHLSLAERVGWILAISFSSIIAFGVLLGALSALTLLL